MATLWMVTADSIRRGDWVSVNKNMDAVSAGTDIGEAMKKHGNGVCGQAVLDSAGGKVLVRVRGVPVA